VQAPQELVEREGVALFPPVAAAAAPATLVVAAAPDTAVVEAFPVVAVEAAPRSQPAAQAA
jgi:hypothetical protein